jgi:hypothetical protein
VICRTGTERLPGLDATLIDLSQPMLDRAKERVTRATAGRITTIQADIRQVRLPAAVSNHPRPLDRLTAAGYRGLEGDRTALFTPFIGGSSCLQTNSQAIGGNSWPCGTASPETFPP